MSRIKEVMDQPLADIKPVLPPAGLYHATLLSGSLGDEKTDKRNRAYQRASLMVRLDRPDEDMPDEAQEEFATYEGEEITGFWSKLLYGRTDTAQLGRLLDAVGVDVNSGGTTKEVLESIKKYQGLPVLVGVKHSNFEGVTRHEITTIAPEDTD